MDSWNWKDRILLQIIPRIYVWVLRLFSLTVRKEYLHEEYPKEFWNQGLHIIISFWHQRLMMMPFLRHSGRVGMLISQHRDGEFIARAVNQFGVNPVRGSTTRGGLSALRGMIRFFRTGANLAITPDGPQGPKHVVQIGVIELARQTGAHILPVTYSASRKKVLGSWDNFVLPIPFCKVAYLWGEPLLIPRDADKDRMEESRQLLQERMRQITEEADRIFQRFS